MGKMKRPSETACKLRFRQINRLRLKFRLHRAVKSPRNLSLQRSFCFRKSAFSRYKFKALSLKASPVKHRSFSFRKPAFSRCKFQAFSFKTSPVRHRSFCFRKSGFSRCKFEAFSLKTSPVRRTSSPWSYGEEEQSMELERRFETLRTLVPGSFGLDAPILLEKAADHITALKMQVEAMQTLAKLLENAPPGAASWPS